MRSCRFQNGRSSGCACPRPVAGPSSGNFAFGRRPLAGTPSELSRGAAGPPDAASCRHVKGLVNSYALRMRRVNEDVTRGRTRDHCEKAAKYHVCLNFTCLTPVVGTRVGALLFVSLVSVVAVPSREKCPGFSAQVAGVTWICISYTGTIYV